MAPNILNVPGFPNKGHKGSPDSDKHNKPVDMEDELDINETHVPAIEIHETIKIDFSPQPTQGHDNYDDPNFNPEKQYPPSTEDHDNHDHHSSNTEKQYPPSTEEHHGNHDHHDNFNPKKPYPPSTEDPEPLPLVGSFSPIPMEPTRTESHHRTKSKSSTPSTSISTTLSGKVPFFHFTTPAVAPDTTIHVPTEIWTPPAKPPNTIHHETSLDKHKQNSIIQAVHTTSSRTQPSEWPPPTPVNILHPTSKTFHLTPFPLSPEKDGIIPSSSLIGVSGVNIGTHSQTNGATSNSMSSIIPSGSSSLIGSIANASGSSPIFSPSLSGSMGDPTRTAEPTSSSNLKSGGLSTQTASIDPQAAFVSNAHNSVMIPAILLPGLAIVALCATIVYRCYIYPNYHIRRARKGFTRLKPSPWIDNLPVAQPAARTVGQETENKLNVGTEEKSSNTATETMSVATPEPRRTSRIRQSVSNVARWTMSSSNHTGSSTVHASNEHESLCTTLVDGNQPLLRSTKITRYTRLT